MLSRSSRSIAPDASRDRSGGEVLSRDVNEEVKRTYSATKPKGVVSRITPLCRLLVYRFKIPLWAEDVRIFELVFVS